MFRAVAGGVEHWVTMVLCLGGWRCETTSIDAVKMFTFYVRISNSLEGVDSLIFACPCSLGKLQGQGSCAGGQSMVIAGRDTSFFRL